MKKIFLVVFSLIMMCSVSFGIEANTEYSATGYSVGSVNGCTIDSYSSTMINDILQNYYSNKENEEHKLAFDSLINKLEILGYEYVVFEHNNRFYLLINNNEYDTDFVFIPKNTTPESYCVGIWYNNSEQISVSNLGHLFGHSANCACNFDLGSSRYIANVNNGLLIDGNIYQANTSVYKMTYVGTRTSYWDGYSYFYKHTPSGGDTGDIPESGTDLTDEQIAKIVERFINSDAYLEKAYYNGDYFITYDNLTGYFRGYSYAWNIDLAIEYGNYNDEGEFVTTGTEEGEAWRIRPYEFSGDIFNKFGDWLASKFNTYSFEYFSISSDSSIKPRYVGSLEHNYCSNYKENEVVIYSSKQIRYVGEETNSEGKTETVITDNYIPPTILKDSVTGEEIIIRDNLQNSSDSLENVITPNADFSGLKEAFEKYISFIDISSITWLTTAISSMITIFVPFVALGIIIFLINRILNGGS